MSMKLLGASFDLHLGGEDLIFPHHEDEIAQSEGAELQTAQTPFVKYWLHVAFLLVEGRKMSKSLGNFYTLRDLFGRGFSGREIRFLLLSAHYRESFNFTLDGLAGARTALARIDACSERLAEVAGTTTAPAAPGLLESFKAAMDDDLNVSAAWGAIFEWVRDQNRLLAEGRLQPVEAASALEAWRIVSETMGLAPASNGEAPPALVQLAADRQAARQARDFKKADQIRDALRAQGWIIEDTPKGPKLKPL
jgi:cysteinyl-tRNA synthetase